MMPSPKTLSSAISKRDSKKQAHPTPKLSFHEESSQQRLPRSSRPHLHVDTRPAEWLLEQLCIDLAQCLFVERWHELAGLA
jgi:hypothetical protein